MADRKFFSFPLAFAAPSWLRPRKAGLLGAPIAGGGSHKEDELSNIGGVLGVPGEEIVSISNFEWRISNWESGN
jgi:hypothetical protein